MNIRHLAILTIVLGALLVSVAASPAQPADNPRAKLAGAIRRALNAVGLKPVAKEDRNLVNRQLPTPECNNSLDCAPAGVTNAPASLIDCDNDNLCICNECFERGPTGRCEEDDCDDYNYDADQRECDDDRPSQLIAFLLSLFLSSTGAANFYIGQDGLAAGQLVILLVLIFYPCVFCYLMCCLGCCVGGGDNDDGIKGKLFGGAISICCSVLSAIVAVCCGLALWAWWLADLIIFATNERDAGNGCSLNDDL